MPSTIARCQQHFETLLRSVVQEPPARLNALKLTLDKADREQQLSDGKQQKNSIFRS